MRSTTRIAFAAAALAVLGGLHAAPHRARRPARRRRATTAAPPTAIPDPTTTPTPGRPADAPVVVLDAGHNGGNAAHPAEINRQVSDGRGGRKACNTTGTATDAGYPEHAFAFDVTGRIAARLGAARVRVVLDPQHRHRGRAVRRRAWPGRRRGRSRRGGLDPRRRGGRRPTAASMSRCPRRR